MNLLIRSIPDLRAAVTMTADIGYPAIKPALRSAQEFVGRFVGMALLEELSGDDLSDDQKELREYACVPIANLALLKYVNSGNVRITDLGVMRTKTNDSGDAFEWQVERVATTFRADAYEGIESMLRYLEGKLTTFSAYTNSDAYKQDKSRLIRSAIVFNDYYEIGSSRLVFQTLNSALRTGESRIRLVLGDTLTNGLLDTTLTATQTLLLEAARRALVYNAIAKALRERLLSITDAGVQVVGVMQFGGGKHSQSPSDAQIQRTTVYFDEQAAQYQSNLVALVQPVTEIYTGPRVIGTAIVAL